MTSELARAEEPSRDPASAPAALVDAHAGAWHLGDLPAIGVTLGAGARWPLAERWRLTADIDVGYGYGKAILGSRQYDSVLAVLRGGGQLALDSEDLFRLEAALGAGPARLSVTGQRENVSATVLSYVAGAGFGVGWFHLEADYFGHSAEPCGTVDGNKVCYSQTIGAAVLLGIQIPLTS